MMFEMIETRDDAMRTLRLMADDAYCRRVPWPCWFNDALKAMLIRFRLITPDPDDFYRTDDSEVEVLLFTIGFYVYDMVDDLCSLRKEDEDSQVSILTRCKQMIFAEYAKQFPIKLDLRQ